MSFERNIRAFERACSRITADSSVLKAVVFLTPDGIEVEMNLNQLRRMKRITWHDLSFRRVSVASHTIAEMANALLTARKP